MANRHNLRCFNKKNIDDNISILIWEIMKDQALMNVHGKVAV